MLRIQSYVCLLCLLVSLSSSLHPRTSFLSASTRNIRQGGCEVLSRSLQFRSPLSLRGGSSRDDGGEASEGGEAWTPLDAEGRASFEDAMKRRFFYTPSFQIYGGVSGLYDYGPPGQAVKRNMLSAWRDFFVVEEGMLEVSCTSVTPKPVLEASGHVARFSDLMVRDTLTGECFRADKLLEDACEGRMKGAREAGRRAGRESGKRQEEAVEDREAEEMEVGEWERLQQDAGALSAQDLQGDAQVGCLLSGPHMRCSQAALSALNVTAPATANPLSEPFPFNLMFQTSIGPTGTSPAFLRPETAQGIFTNFRRLLDYNGGRLPFAVAQVGKAFRNEIAPKQGLLRVREFEMAEIEHFLPRTSKSHPKFGAVAEIEAAIWSARMQQDGKRARRMRLKEAVAEGTICNEALGYFLGRTIGFLQLCGIHSSAIRLRQHKPSEMAHYADDCWDAEALTSYGWVELVGHADRACFDLKMHSEATGTPLVAFETFLAPVTTEALVATLHKPVLGKAFKKQSGAVGAELERIVEEGGAAAEALQQALQTTGKATITVDGQDVEVSSAMVTVEMGSKKETGVTFHPAVIEPSFGLDRIFYTLLEHAFYVRARDEQRTVLRLPAWLAPYQCSLTALVADKQTDSLCADLLTRLRRHGLSCRVDDSAAAIGKRYARMDMLGVPFALTLDPETLKDHAVTVRERDSMTQVRVPLAQAPTLLASLCTLPHLEGYQTWADAAIQFAQT